MGNEGRQAEGCGGGGGDGSDSWVAHRYVGDAGNDGLLFEYQKVESETEQDLALLPHLPTACGNREQIVVNLLSRRRGRKFNASDVGETR